MLMKSYGLRVSEGSCATCSLPTKIHIYIYFVYKS